jgi:sugar phosphate isomerase/epimerase
MQQILSTHLFVNHRLTAVWLDRIQAAGFPYVEIFCARQHIDYRDKAQVRELSHWFRESELKLWSVHAPMYTDTVWGRSGPDAVINIAETKKVERIRMVDEIKRALEIAEQIPFHYLIQHIGVRNETFDQHKQDAAFNSLEELRVFAGQRDVQILLENTPNQLSSAETLERFLRTTHMDLKYCFDIGHAHMGEGIAPEFELMKERIRSTHIHDNDGKDDLHLFPLHNQGNIDWPTAMRLLGERGEQYPLVLELREQHGVEHPVERAKKMAEDLDRLI